MKTIRNLLLIAFVLIQSGNTFAGEITNASKFIQISKEKLIQSSNLQDDEELLERANNTIKEAVKAMDKIMKDPETSIPVSLLNESEGIVVFPGAFKVAIGTVGGQGGRGIAMIRKEDGSWSNPFFVMLGEGSVGLQIGAQVSDIVLLFNNRDNIMKMEEAEITLGSDISATAGPENKEISANTDIKFEAEIYSYYRSKGLFAGVSVSGGVLKYNNRLNNVFYETEVTVSEIFNEIETPFNAKVNVFIQTLNEYSK